MKKTLLLSILFALVALAGFSAPEQNRPDKPEEKQVSFKFSKAQVDAMDAILKETTVEYNIGVQAVELVKSWQALFSKDKTEIEVKTTEAKTNALYTSIDNNNGNHNLCRALLNIVFTQAQPQLAPPKKE